MAISPHGWQAKARRLWAPFQVLVSGVALVVVFFPAMRSGPFRVLTMVLAFGFFAFDTVARYRSGTLRLTIPQLHRQLRSGQLQPVGALSTLTGALAPIAVLLVL